MTDLNAILRRIMKITGVDAGHMRIPNAPGWGTDLNETAGRRHAFTG